MKRDFEILYEDEFLIAINKEAGILTIPDRFNSNLPNLANKLKQFYPDLIPVHRLDKFTSGVILFAKDKETHRLLSISFESREIEKYYTAIVDGIPAPESGRIDVPLSESTVTRGKMLAHKRGKESITEYKILQEFKRFSLIYIRIFTGRMHQVRVHMQYLGNPLVVDKLYGNREALYLSEIKHKKFNLGKFEEEKPLLSRQPLHATKLVIPHPYKEELITVEAPLPKDMVATIKQMGKWVK